MSRSYRAWKGYDSALFTLTSALGAIKDAHIVLARHTQPGVGHSPATGIVTAKGAAVGSAKFDIDSLQGKTQTSG